ncbi:hypothetical protein DYBT9623_01718 [Dyadobacter sp. CECT 9623]|uniref:Lipoprotein n=1 Tax=Dyadobacter linearis TaxID=2823330 RepID=A0ABM8UNF7_9BACT|nr:hypothetical protein [Dyadobacter sp. CECT 9623]CAG5068984.1 hypothetical protein DYBT9623_01718 [Dyadobacter sp. CECT 9623]
MGKIRVFGCLVCTALLLSDCLPSRKVRSSFRKYGFCFHGTKQLTETSGLRFDGYYSFNYTRLESDPNGSASFPVDIAFFGNGMFIYGYRQDYFKSVENKSFGFYNRGTQWGTYKIDGDRIKCQFMESPGGMSMNLGYVWLKLISPAALDFLILKYYDPVIETDLASELTVKQAKQIGKGKFVSQNKMPDPERSWIIRKSWFWCDKNEFRKWEASRK